jgi:hypothetical protein
MLQQMIGVVKLTGTGSSTAVEGAPLVLAGQPEAKIFTISQRGHPYQKKQASNDGVGACKDDQDVKCARFAFIQTRIGGYPDQHPGSGVSLSVLPNPHTNRTYLIVSEGAASKLRMVSY